MLVLLLEKCERPLLSAFNINCRLQKCLRLQYNVIYDLNHQHMLITISTLAIFICFWSLVSLLRMPGLRCQHFSFWRFTFYTIAWQVSIVSNNSVAAETYLKCSSFIVSDCIKVYRPRAGLWISVYWPCLKFGKYNDSFLGELC